MTGPLALVDTMGKSKLASHDTSAARESRKRHPGFGWCLRCGMSNPEVEDHTVHYGNAGMSPTCEECWRLLNRQEKIEYCRALFRSWRVGHLRMAWSANVKEFEDHPEWQKVLEVLELEPIQAGDEVWIGNQRGVVCSGEPAASDGPVDIDVLIRDRCREPQQFTAKIDPATK